MESDYAFSESNLRRFWNQAAEKIGPYHKAPSTKIYFDQEKRLINSFCCPLEGKTLLKTDLWNEAKNTQILKWVKGEKAQVYGLDISDLVVSQAIESVGKDSPGLFLMVSDLRLLPFPENCFDYIYSMGTIEHVPDYELALQEMFRVLKQGGTAIIGVPNKFDVFLRPLQVSFLQKVGLYPFGYEECFSKREMIQILGRANFKVVAQSSLLCLPGILRILDLFFYHHFRPVVKITEILLKPFELLYDRFEFFRHYGYLIAFVVEK